MNETPKADGLNSSKPKSWPRPSIVGRLDVDSYEQTITREEYDRRRTSDVRHGGPSTSRLREVSN